MSEGEKTEYVPHWAPLVKGWYTERDEDGVAKVGASCTKCLASFGPRTCTSGMVRQHVNNFALSHTHRGPFDTP